MTFARLEAIRCPSRLRWHDGWPVLHCDLKMHSGNHSAWAHGADHAHVRFTWRDEDEVGYSAEAHGLEPSPDRPRPHTDTTPP